jgi:hypothetical protein
MRPSTRAWLGKPGRARDDLSAGLRGGRDQREGAREPLFQHRDGGRDERGERGEDVNRVDSLQLGQAARKAQEL